MVEKMKKSLLWCLVCLVCLIPCSGAALAAEAEARTSKRSLAPPPSVCGFFVHDRMQREGSVPAYGMLPF